MPAVGFLHSASVRNYQPLVNAFREGLANAGLCRRPKCRDRVSLGGKSARPAAGARRRPGPPPCRGDRSLRQPDGCIGGEVSDYIYSDCVRERGRPRADRTGYEPQPSRRQRHGHHKLQRRTGRKAPGIAARARAICDINRRIHQPGPARIRCAVGADPGGSARNRAAAAHRQSSERTRPRCGFFEPGTTESRWARHDCRRTLH
jgi:hypothetical protein